MTSQVKNKISHPFLPLFLGFFLLYSILTLLFTKFVYTDSVYFQSLSDQLAAERISNIVSVKRKWEWMGYALLPLVLLIKTVFVASCLFISSFLGNIEIHWRDLFRVAVFSELVFVTAGLFRFAWLLCFPAPDIDSLNNFSPLSLTQLLQYDLPGYLRYAFQTINAFECCYWLMLAKGIQPLTGKGFGYCLGIVAKGYGVGLFLWILFVTFIFIQLS